MGEVVLECRYKARKPQADGDFGPTNHHAQFIMRNTSCFSFTIAFTVVAFYMNCYSNLNSVQKCPFRCPGSLSISISRCLLESIITALSGLLC